MNKNILYLLTILEAIEKIKLYTIEFSNANTFFQANHQKEFNATLNLLIAIGEEAKKIEPSLKSLEPTIDWDAISGLRNELSHNYRGIDLDIIWDIVQSYLEPLKQACIHMLNQLNLQKDQLSKILASTHYRHIQYLI